MTSEQREMAVTMLESGCTYAQVARNLGCSRQYIQKTFGCQKFREMRDQARIRKCKYPAIMRYLVENDMTEAEFAKRCYVSRATMTKMLVYGKVSNATVEQVLRVTGMSFEEAFEGK